MIVVHNNHSTNCGSRSSVSSISSSDSSSILQKPGDGDEEDKPEEQKKKCKAYDIEPDSDGEDKANKFNDKG